jgi:hypothetical protein
MVKRQLVVNLTDCRAKFVSAYFLRGSSAQHAVVGQIAPVVSGRDLLANLIRGPVLPCGAIIPWTGCALRLDAKISEDLFWVIRAFVA